MDEEDEQQESDLLPTTFEKELFELVNDYAKRGVSKPNIIRKLVWVIGSVKMS